MKDLQSKIEEVKRLMNYYESLIQQQDPNRRNVIDAYLNWHSAALVLFDGNGIPPEDPYLKNFNSVNNSGNGYVLYYNFKSIKSSFNVLINRIERMDAKTKGNIHNKKVFIVHGHDSGTKEMVARFIEKCGLEAIILHEQVNQGQTIIEKLESNTNVGFGVVLYTPCDRGGENKKDAKLKPRARENVVFEHGYLIGKLGRTRVVALLKEGVEIPGDLDGKLYTPIDEGGAWKMELAKELIEAGFDIDLKKLI